MGKRLEEDEGSRREEIGGELRKKEGRDWRMMKRLVGG